MKLVKLQTDKELIGIVKQLPVGWPDYIRVMAVEILEYRKAYGPLGCESLDVESDAFKRMS